MSPTGNFQRLSSHEQQRLEPFLERFEEAWRQHQPPRLEAFLPPEPSPVLEELVHVDLEHRVKIGLAARVESYLDRFPQLAGDPSILLELVRAEYDLRRRGEPALTAAEYLRRFPQYRPQLEMLLAPTLPPGLGGAPTTVGGAAADTQQPIPGRPAKPTGEQPEVPGYEILGELGRGGMGVVYKARQVGLNRLVALKMIRAGAQAGPDELVRFRIEAETVAELRHPHIVQIIEVSEQQGQPYFVLEYLEGGSLAQQLQGTPQPAREAAQLVASLADAMHHAHENGIIHRDLKPANILLASGGREPPDDTAGSGGSRPPLADLIPKITDFGLAKRLEGGESLTQSGAIVGTPSYMAPEQAWGKSKQHQVGPAADIYALGAILYQLLTGRPPFVGETALDTLQQVLTQEPVPPRQLQPKVPRDLETICLKCLEKNPRKRYPSAALLGERLRMFLEGRPIPDRPIGMVERLGRWARRNPIVAGLSAALLLVLAGGLAAVTGLWLEAAGAKDAAETNLDLGRRNIRLVKKERDAAAAAHHQAETNLTLANANFNLARKAVDDCFLIAKDDPIFQQENMRQARKLLLARALPFYEGFRAQRQNDEDIQSQLAENYFRTGFIEAELGRPADALKAFANAHQLQHRLALRHPTAPQYQEDLAVTCNNLGNVQGELGSAAAAWKWYAEALRVRAQLALQHPEVPKYASALATTYFNQGTLQAERGDRASARESFTQALRLQEPLVDRHPQVAQYRTDLAETWNNLGNVQAEGGDLAAARKSHEQVLRLREQLVARHPKVRAYRLKLAATCFNLASLSRASGQLEDSLTWQTRNIAFLEEELRRGPEEAAVRLDLRDAFTGRARVLAALGRREEAARDWDQAAELAEQSVRPLFRLYYARALVQAGKHALAAAEVERLARDETLPGEIVYDLARVWSLATAAVRKDEQLSPGEQKRLSDQYAAQALELLGRARSAGYFRMAEAIAQVKKEADFDPLHLRKDFQRFLAEIESGKNQGGTKKP